jgi:ABC-2 type transport system permease protein
VILLPRAVRAEWIKLRSVRSTWWLSLAAFAGLVATGAAALATLSTTHCSPVPPGCDEDTVRLSLAGVYVGQIAVLVLAVLAVSTEYSTRTIRTTVVACPTRLPVLAAKIGVVLGVVLCAGALGVLGSLIAGRVILPANGFVASAGYPPLSLADGPTLRAAASTVLYLGLIALLGLGAAAALRDTALSLVTLLGLLFAFPTVAAFIADEVWRDRVLKFSPMAAGLAAQATKRLDALPIGPWPGLGVLAAYAGGATVLGAVLFRVRDA